MLTGKFVATARHRDPSEPSDFELGRCGGDSRELESDLPERVEGEQDEKADHM